MAPKLTTLALPGIAFVLIALAALALSTSATAAPTCPSYAWAPLDPLAMDRDNDGFHDGVIVYQNTPPTGNLSLMVLANATLRTESGTVVFFYEGVASLSDAYYGGYSMELHTTSSFSHENYTVTVMFDEGNGTCQTESTVRELWPLGMYQVDLSASSLAQTVDQGTVARYNLTVHSSSNNEDTTSLYASSSEGWFVEFSAAEATLAPNASATIVVTVHVPANADPQTSDNTTITALSARDITLEEFIVIRTTVSAQTFALAASADDPTLSEWPGRSATFIVGIENQGNNQDTVSLQSSAPPIGWSAELSTDALTLNAGELSTATLTVWIPTSLAGATAWTVTLTATAGNGQTHAEVELTTSMVLPDLAIGDADIVVDASGVRAGDLLGVYVTVRNVGATVPFEAVVLVTDGARVVSATVALDDAGVAVARFAWLAVAGQGPLHVTLDATRAVPESREDNNEASHGLVVNVPPVAVVPTSALSSQAGANVTLNADGSSDADGTVVAYAFDFGDGSSTGWITSASAAHTYLEAGTYFAKVRVRDNTGLESEAATAVVTVAAAPPASGGGAAAASGGSDIAFGLVGVIAGLGAGMGLMAVLARKKPPTSGA